MRYSEFRPLSEGVSIKSPVDLAAYAVTVAEAYDAAPVHDTAVEKAWRMVAQHNEEVLFKRLSSTIKVEFSETDPYSVHSDDPAMQVRYMLYDMLVNKRLQIYSGHSDDHPAFSPQENVVLRTVHDAYTHAKLLAPFKKGLEELVKKNGGKMPTEEELKDWLPKIDLAKHGNTGHAFSLRGELNSFSTHSQIAPKGAVPALFTEIPGQACYNTVVGDFPRQKVALLGGFDYKNVGKFVEGSDAEKRFLEVKAEIEGGAEVIELHIRAKKKIGVKALMAAVTRR